MIRVLALGLVAFALVCGCDDTADRCARICHKLIACFPKASSSLDKECRLGCKDASAALSATRTENSPRIPSGPGTGLVVS